MLMYLYLNHNNYVQMYSMEKKKKKEFNKKPKKDLK